MQNKGTHQDLDLRMNNTMGLWPGVIAPTNQTSTPLRRKLATITKDNYADAWQRNSMGNKMGSTTTVRCGKVTQNVFLCRRHQPSSIRQGEGQRKSSSSQFAVQLHQQQCN